MALGIAVPGKNKGKFTLKCSGREQGTNYHPLKKFSGIFILTKSYKQTPSTIDGGGRIF